MDTSMFLITAPTADTAGTTLMLQSPKRSYVFGNMSEGTQRAITQMGSRMVKVQDFFVTGRTEWRNVGGLIGMTLTLADVTSTSYETSMEVYRKKASTSKVSEPERPKLSVHGAPNLKHLLSTCRRFIFRKGMPITATEYKSNDPIRTERGAILPSWQDDVIKVWAMSVAPENQIQDARAETALAQRRKSFDSRLNDFDDHRAPDGESPEERDARYDLIRTSVLKQMFDSSWTFDTLVERPISEVEMPAAMYTRNPRTNRLETYTGPMPTAEEPLSDVKVLTRTPWPAALVFNLPPTEPAAEAVSYIVRSHTARGKFDVKRAKQLGVPPGRAYSQLTAGESVTNDKGDTITPDMVMGADRLGQGVAILDVPSVDYLNSLLQREELVSDSVMEGVHTYIWILGAGVSGNRRLNDFMQKLNHVQHVVSSPDTNPNHLSMDSVAAQTIRLGQIDSERYHIPSHDNTTIPQRSFRDMNSSPQVDLGSNAIVAKRGMKWRVMPKHELQMGSVPPFVDVAAVQQETSPEILELVRIAHENIENSREAHEAWKQLVARPDSEIITLGTGSALPSKYRNVSATLVRIPGIGNYLFDCGENTIGQLQRVFSPEELVGVLRNLRMIWISHLHADHHLGTTSVIKAWYEVVHRNVPLHSTPSEQTIPNNASDYGLTVISHTGMLRWLHEYASVEDFGYSRILPLNILPAAPGDRSGSKLVLAEFGQHQSEHVISPEDYQSIFGFTDIQATLVRHCHGAMAVSITFPGEEKALGINPLKVSYSGDCRPSADFATIGKDTTVLIHEATFDDELQGDARAKKHSTTSEALGIGAQMDAKAVVLTHFSQRYQKIPVLETVQDGDEETLPNAAEHANGAGQVDPDTEMTVPDSVPSAPPTLKQENSKEQVIKIRNPNMKVAIAFDYMRVKIGDIAKLEKFNDALNKLLVTEEDETKSVKGGDAGLNGNGKKNGNGKEGGKSKKVKRGN